MDNGKRMTYEQQRALREQQQQESMVDRFSIDNYGTGGRTSAASSRSRTRSGSSRQSANRNGSAGTARRSNTQQDRSSTSRNRTTSRQRQSTTQRASRQDANGADGSSARQTSSRRTTARQATRRSTSATGTVRHTTRDSFSRANYGGEAVANIPFKKIGIAVALLVVVIVFVQLCSAITPITVTVNGSQYELRGAKNMQTALNASGLPINPGDLISLNGNVLEKSKGHPFAATVNDQQTADPDYKLRDGDVISIADGEDIVEEYDSEESSIPYSSSILGSGAVHKFIEGAEGVMETRTGRLSGETVEKQITAPEDAVCSEYNLNVGSNKVIALTFDDGPSSEYTASVLDILKENDVKATFFVIGTQVEAYPDLVQREYDEGHQVCTHSYDHADPAGGTSIALMDAAGQVNEIVNGYKTITDVLGGEASRVTRFPGGNIDDAVVLNLMPYVDYEIGWNIDTEDWTLPGSDAIYQSLISAKPGDIILCHDGGGDRSETVDAIKRAIPYLKSQGFKFLTMDEILEYPAESV